MRKTMGGIAAVVALLGVGSSSGLANSIKDRNDQNKYLFDRFVGGMMWDNYMGIGCPTYGSMLEPKIYDYTLTYEDIDATNGDTLQVLHLSTNRILRERRLWGEKITGKTVRDTEFLLPIQNPRFYNQHKFKAGETIQYAVFHSDGIGGTLNCTL